MSWITNVFARNWRNIHFILVIVFSIILMVASSSVNPVVDQIVFTVFYSPFAEIKNSLSELGSVAEENRQLRQELTEASVTIAVYEEASRENERLRSVLGFEPPPGYVLLPAEVLSISGEYLPMSAIINLGENDSIFVNQPVINQQGLIGRISSVTPGYATVQLLTDPSNRVAARLAASREMGIIKFTTSEGMILDNFPIQGTVVAGDTILSSGLGGVYPPGLMVGTVAQVVRPEQEPFCDVRVTPAVNFYSIDELFILQEVVR